MRVFRERVIKLPKSEIANVVTSIQMVRPRGSGYFRLPPPEVTC